MIQILSVKLSETEFKSSTLSLNYTNDTSYLLTVIHDNLTLVCYALLSFMSLSFCENVLHAWRAIFLRIWYWDLTFCYVRHQMYHNVICFYCLKLYKIDDFIVFLTRFNMKSFTPIFWSCVTITRLIHSALRWSGCKVQSLKKQTF